ncbi:hypothetical protein VP01_4482g2 [Puccinia sorghi]|uniref:Tc1-like transposase DDE domain-containing protein n=1 Tax=Puccinia sorghi TaxID=27349 RepID=A0A0L6UP95_9BASI|nr:hypothetical protein VP01_4482g2 [Puccinia sorghi]
MADPRESKGWELIDYHNVKKMQHIPAEFLVFTGNFMIFFSPSDETAVCEKYLLQTFACSTQVTSSVHTIICQNTERINLLPAISLDSVIAMTVREDTINSKMFLPWMNRYPAPNLVLVCDSSKVHKVQRVQQLCNKAGVLLIYLPPYTAKKNLINCLQSFLGVSACQLQAINPIDLCFAVVESKLQQTQAISLTQDAEWEVCRTSAGIMSQELCTTLYRHFSYNMLFSPQSSPSVFSDSSPAI